MAKALPPVTKRSMYFWVLHKNRPLQLAMVTIIVVTVFMRLVPIEMQKRIVSDAIQMKKIDALIYYCMIYISAVFAAGILKYSINILQSKVGEHTLFRLRNELYDHILTLPMPFFRRTSPGLVVSTLMAELLPMATFAGMAISAPLVNILTFIAFAGYMLYLDPLLAALSISIYPVEMLVIPILQRKYNTLNRKKTIGWRRTSSIISESMTGIHEIQGNCAYSLEESKFKKSAHWLYDITYRLLIVKFGIKFTNNLFQSLGPFILFLIGGYLAIQGKFELGALVAFLSAYEKLYDPWKELMEFYQLYQDCVVRYKQVMDYFDLMAEFPSMPTDRDVYKLKGDIAINDLSFTIGSNIRLLDNIDLHISAGEHLALVGFSGSGKSTLASAVGQMLKYTGGSVQLDGHEVSKMTVADITEDTLIELMVGRKLEDQYPRIAVAKGDIRLQTEKLSAAGVNQVCLNVCEGEIVGVAGLMGAGRTELMKAIFGANPLTGGCISICGRKINIRTPKDALDAGIAFISEDRKADGLILGLSVKQNMTLSALKHFSHTAGQVHHSKERDAVDEYIDTFNIKTPSRRQPVGNLSGGNQQKVAIAKGLMTRPKVLILDEPTRGVDVGAKKEIYQLINTFKKEGMSIILVSSDMPEILGMSDRIVVMHEGCISGEFTAADANQENIMACAVGKKR